MSVACLAAESFACACCPLNERILHELIRDDEAFSSKRSGRRLNPAASCVFTLLWALFTGQNHKTFQGNRLQSDLCVVSQTTFKFPGYNYFKLGVK